MIWGFEDLEILVFARKLLDMKDLFIFFYIFFATIALCTSSSVKFMVVLAYIRLYPKLHTQD